MLNEDTIRTICWCIVAAFGIQGATIYSCVRLLATGKPLFERKPGGGRVIGMGVGDAG